MRGRTRTRTRTMAGMALLAAALTGACGDSTGIATDYDPYRALDQLDRTIDPMAADVDLLVGLDLAVETLYYYGGTAYTGLLSVNPDRRQDLLESLRTRRSRALRPVAGTGGDRADGSADASLHAGALALPGSLLGATLVWDPVDGYRVSNLEGAPFDGVRFVLYRLDPATDLPVYPLSPFGYVDLVETGSTGGEAVTVRAYRTAGANRRIARYTVALAVSGSYSEGSTDLEMEGEIGDGTVLDMALSERMTWSQSRDRDELDLAYRYDRGSQTVRLRGHAESRFDALDWATFDFELEFPDLRPSSELDAGIDRDGRIHGEIRSGGRTAIRIGGYDGRPTFERADREPLTASDLDALEQLWLGVGDLIGWTEFVLVPADLLVL